MAEQMANDVAIYYSDTELPKFTSKKIMKAEINDMSIAGTPVCHISVGRWMKGSGDAFLTDERAERCARCGTLPNTGQVKKMEYTGHSPLRLRPYLFEQGEKLCLDSEPLN